MTVFEDLIVELKEENLLEDTVLSVAGDDEEHSFAELIDEGASEISEGLRGSQRSSLTRSLHVDSASEQISTLQTVEHIVASIERASTGQDLSGFDELRAKKAFHHLQQASVDPSSSEYLEAQSGLSTQISVWTESLAARNAAISVSSMRLYCETCQPALSAQALFALARFNRDLSFSESSRGKYEFVVTRLFSKKKENGKRELICSKEEMLGHLRTRFSERVEHGLGSRERRSSVEESACIFDKLAGDAESSGSLQDLLVSDLLDRLCRAKQEASEDFFSPEVTAAAVGCNIRVFNRLMAFAVAELKSDGLTRFGNTYDDRLSDAVAKTVVLGSLAPEDSDDEVESYPLPKADRIDRDLIERRRDPRTEEPTDEAAKKGSFFAGFAKVNRWLLATTITVVILSVGLYVWVNYYSDANLPSSDVKVVDVSASQFKDLLKEGRISSDTFYGITTPSWDTLSKESQQEAVQKIYQSLTEKGCKRVSLINSKGQPVGFATNGRAEVYRP